MEINQGAVSYARSPTIRLLAGLAITLSAVAIWLAAPRKVRAVAGRVDRRASLGVDAG